MNFVARLFSLRRSPRLALAVEIAFVTPALFLLAIAGYAWGGYLLLNHQVQAAAEQALVSVGGIGDPGERERRARSVVAHILASGVSMAPGRSELAIESRANRMTVTVIYDASRSPIFAIRRILALPPPMITGIASRGS